MANKLYERDMTYVSQAATCALPVMFVSKETPGFPGVDGTCTALRYRNEIVFVTAAHVIERSDQHTAIYVPLAFSGSELRCQIGRVLKPRAAEEHRDAPVDLAVMFPIAGPGFADGDSSACGVPPYADMERVARDRPFAIAGFPLDAPDRNTVDYDGGLVRFGKQVAFGTYETPSCMTGLHTLTVSTAGTWGPNGFSGGPAFRLLRGGGTGPWKPAFAGIVTNGGPETVHFIDAAFVIGCLHALNVGG